jgi:asparagine synthetase B (glutamine-hydrolysing)
MRGICGMLHLHGQPLDVVVGQRMMDLLWHRGPDDSGSLVLQAPASQTSPSIFLGHCRLKIIDLSDAARQPLANDERPYAEMAARHFKTDHTEFVVKADAVALMERLIWHHDQLYGDSSAIPTYLVSTLARQQVTVVLNGDGGDEVFAGYDRFLEAFIAQRVPGWMAPMGRALTRCLPR